MKIDFPRTGFYLTGVTAKYILIYLFIVIALDFFGLEVHLWWNPVIGSIMSLIFIIDICQDFIDKKLPFRKE